MKKPKFNSRLRAAWWCILGRAVIFNVSNMSIRVLPNNLGKPTLISECTLCETYTAPFKGNVYNSHLQTMAEKAVEACMQTKGGE